MATRRIVRIGGVELGISLDERWTSRLRALLQRGARSREAGAAEPPGAPKATLPPNATPAQQELARRIDAVPWYHTLDLGDGTDRHAIGGNHTPALRDLQP
jgi:hypothetical protein